VASNRRLTVGFVGNCQAELLQKAFRQATPSADYASFYHFFDVAEDRRAMAGADIANCDVLLMQDIQDLEAYPLRDAIPASTKVLSFPFLRFASPWPYDDFNGLRDSVARAKDDPSLHTVTYYDGVLGRLRRQLPEPQARLAAYKAHGVASMIDPARVHDFETRRLLALDDRFGIAIGRTILDGFRRHQLFYTVNRPCGVLLSLVLDRIFAMLNLKLPPVASGELDELAAIQVPVHPFVAERLSITWASETRRYRNGDREMTWEEFVRAYIARYG
jgi:polysaccharide biosynthesis acetyltransferase WcbI-like protein